MAKYGRLALGLSLLALARAADAQAVLDRTPNLSGAWVGSSGVLHFNFLHRFSVSPAPERKVTSAPTFLFAAGAPGRTLLGAHYATNSQLSPRYPNEWEVFGRLAPAVQTERVPLDASLQLGYNFAAEGFDGEAAISRRQGPLRVLAAVRVLAEPGAASGADVALASGVVVRLNRSIALTGDVASLTDRTGDEDVAWGAGVSLAIPQTPHTLSLHATNANNASLQSSSRGTNETRYGFEFTIPLTLRRYFGNPAAEEPRLPPRAAGSHDTVVVNIQNFAFRPAELNIQSGTTVVWANGDQVTHTASGEGQSFDTGAIPPGEQRSVTFDRRGTFPFHCTPHPFMRGAIVVR